MAFSNWVNILEVTKKPINLYMINVDLFTFIEWYATQLRKCWIYYLIKAIQTSPSKIVTAKPFDICTHNTVHVQGISMFVNFSLPPFRPAVLEPGFDLGIGHFERLGQGGSLGGCQILLSVESLLQLHDLKAGERCPRLLTFGRRSVLVRMPDSTCYWKDWNGYM